MQLHRNLKTLASAVVLAAASLSFSAPGAQASSEVSYKMDIQPIFDSFCVMCHNPAGSGYEASGLDLSTYEGLMKGTRFGPIVSAGDPLTSNLMAVLEGRTDASITMPHSDRRAMTQADRRVLRTWIVEGATKPAYENGPEQVMAVLCMDCHTENGSGLQASGLDMSSYESLMKGTRHGPIIVPGDPLTSNLMVLVEGRAKSGLKMPHKDQGAPSVRDRNTLRRWILQGAHNN
ncbi:MAG: hypothetical protein HQL35_12530 [Alphaproteobacteria bacterium]|nr:hypothetical protein [Alphaproteobacteria bacterium]